MAQRARATRFPWHEHLELHESFLGVVEQLGGVSIATGTPVYRLMLQQRNMDLGGLTINHVRTHLRTHKLNKCRIPPTADRLGLASAAGLDGPDQTASHTYGDFAAYLRLVDEVLAEEASEIQHDVQVPEVINPAHNFFRPYQGVHPSHEIFYPSNDVFRPRPELDPSVGEVELGQGGRLSRELNLDGGCWENCYHFSSSYGQC